MTPLQRLESQSIYIFREAFSCIDNIAMLWSIGKDFERHDLARAKAFLGQIPFPVMHLDTGEEFPETYEFRERYVKEWNLKLIADIAPPSSSPISRCRLLLGLLPARRKGLRRRWRSTTSTELLLASAGMSRLHARKNGFSAREAPRGNQIKFPG